MSVAVKLMYMKLVTKQLKLLFIYLLKIVGYVNITG